MITLPPVVVVAGNILRVAVVNKLKVEKVEVQVSGPEGQTEMDVKSVARII